MTISPPATTSAPPAPMRSTVTPGARPRGICAASAWRLTVTPALAPPLTPPLAAPTPAPPLVAPVPTSVLAVLLAPPEGVTTSVRTVVLDAAPPLATAGVCTVAAPPLDAEALSAAPARPAARPAAAATRGSAFTDAWAPFGVTVARAEKSVPQPLSARERARKP
ncbi:MAG: hypothetical protein R3A52_19675 [Polyangiales bacterium]